MTEVATWNDNGSSYTNRCDKGIMIVVVMIMMISEVMIMMISEAIIMMISEVMIMMTLDQ